MRQRRKTTWKARLLRAVAVAVGLWIVLSMGAVVGLRFVDPPTTAVMLLEAGSVRSIEYRWVGRDAISVNAVRAAVAAEDQRFLDHHGIDIDALGVAISDYRRGQGLRGASTITQQVAKNLFLWNGRSFARKLLEAWFAVLIDVAWSKQRILEVYLNVAEFGPGVFGVEAAANRFFGVTAAELSSSQSATLAAVLPSPKRMNAGNPGPYVESRRADILRQMQLLEQRGHYRGLDWPGN